MTKSNLITLILEGVPELDGRIRLTTLLAELQSLSAAIGRVSRETAPDAPTAMFNIEELSYNSPMRIVVAPALGQEQIAFQALQRFGAVAGAVTSGANLDSIDSDLLREFKSLAKPVGKQLSRATLIINDQPFPLTSQVAQHVEAALETDEECIGVIEGLLEQINIHGGANTFHVYPDVGPRKVSCHFPSALTDEAIFAVGRKVEVSGTLKYRHGATFPHSITVAGIDPLPPEGELPNWDDLRGRAPGATGLLSSEAFVRELRDAWE